MPEGPTLYSLNLLTSLLNLGRKRTFGPPRYNYPTSMPRSSVKLQHFENFNFLLPGVFSEFTHVDHLYVHTL